MDFYARFYQSKEEAAAYTLIEAKINSWKSWISIHVFLKARKGSCLYTD